MGIDDFTPNVQDKKVCVDHPGATGCKFFPTDPARSPQFVNVNNAEAEHAAMPEKLPNENDSTVPQDVVRAQTIAAKARGRRGGRRAARLQERLTAEDLSAPQEVVRAQGIAASGPDPCLHDELGQEPVIEEALPVPQDVVRMVETIVARDHRARRPGGRGYARLQEESADKGSAVPHDVGNTAQIAFDGHGCRRRGGKGRSRLYCHIFLDPAMLEPGFDLVKKLIGKGGTHTRAIFEATRTKVRVRGRGSEHIETDGREAPVPLMIALAAEHNIPEDFRTAFTMTKKHLFDMSALFDKFMHRRGQLNESTAEHRRFWVGEMSEASKACLGPLLDGLL
jgi:hypothetical protein